MRANGLRKIRRRRQRAIDRAKLKPHHGYRIVCQLTGAWCWGYPLRAGDRSQRKPAASWQDPMLRIEL